MPEPRLIELLRDYLTAHGWRQSLDGRWLPKGANHRRGKQVVFISLMGAVQQQLEEEYYERQRAKRAIELGEAV